MFVRGHWKACVTMGAVTARVDNRTEHSSPTLVADTDPCHVQRSTYVDVPSEPPKP